MRRRFLSVLMAFLLVTSGITASTGSAAAVDTSNCSDLDKFIDMAVQSWSLGMYDGIEHCLAPDQGAIEELNNLSDSQAHVDLYSAMAGQDAQQEAFMAPFNNYLNDTQSIAWMRAQSAIAEAYQDGKTKAEAKVAARQAISNYYATKQKNLVEQYNVTVQSWYQADEKANNQSLGDATVYLGGSGGGDSYHDIRPQGTQTMTLVNGNTTEVPVFKAKDSDFNPATYPLQNPLDGLDYRYIDGGVNDHLAEYFAVAAPNSNYNTLRIRFKSYTDGWSRIQTMNSNLQTEAENFVDATWSDFDSGNVNASDVISANTAMWEYGVRSYNETEGLYSSTAALALMGFDTPNMTSSGTMDVTYNGNTYSGLVLARHAPGGTWETGTTYNTSNITGPVFMATTTGDKVDFAEGETFTIDQMRSKDGTNVTSTQTTKYVYQTANTSELLEMQDQLTQLRAEIEARKSNLGGGGSGLGGSSGTAIAIAALIGAALLLGRSEQ